MRFKNSEFQIYFFIWIVVLLIGVRDIILNFVNAGLGYFLTLDFYTSVLLLACMIALFIGLIKGNTRVVVLAFGGIVTIEAVQFFPLFLSTAQLTANFGLRGYETIGLLYIILNGFVLPLSMVVYALTYIVCMVYYFFNKRFRHTLIPIVSGLGVVVLLAALGSTTIDLFFRETKPDLLDIFFDMASAVFFHIIYITLPRLMHEHNLY